MYSRVLAAAATRKLWWNLFRICYISAVAVSCTVEDSSLAFVFERDASPRTAGARLASAQDSCANLDSERTCSAASAGAERSASASAARAVAVGCTVEDPIEGPKSVSPSSSSVLPRLAPSALFWPARETPAPPPNLIGRALAFFRLRRSQAIPFIHTIGATIV